MFPNYRIKIRRKKDPHSRTTHLPDPIATLAPAAIPRPPRPRPTPPPLPHPWPAPPQPPHPRPAPPSPPAPVRHRRGRPAPGRTPAPSGSGGDGATPPPGAPRGSPDPAPAAICPHCSRRGPGHQPRRHRVLPPASTATVASLSSASTTAAALCPRPTRRLPPSNQPGALAGPSPASATNHPPINGAPLGICAAFWSNALLCKLQSLVLPCSRRRSRRAAPRHHVQLVNKDSEGVAATFQM
ncbi:hypothetical protein VPH35_082075 [Triticum aestivum]|uniref:basic proline-rich protein n=1 Tax=Triticum aestivum TaxID=4565 RepID=UPI001D0235C5|nr:basic proline-rich protein-like [Triticum aestivum]